ncbi:MAG: TonB-dependent receptor [Gemmatimonadaceae bacterium]
MSARRVMQSWRIAVALVLFTHADSLAAQAGQVLRGTVRSQEGAPIPGANVFVIETLDGALTDSAGRFAFAVTAPRPYTLLVKRIGFEELRREVAPADPADLAIVIRRATTMLAPITVQAGAYTAGEERGATLTPLEVVTTPGTSADINRAIQLLPGVQAVDDGTALFVRGGDYTETKVFMNEAPLLNPAQLLTPTGTFVGTVDPFQLDGIFFSSGGFGARYGNALSGVVGLRTRGAATRNAATVGAGLAALSADLAVRPAQALTLRFAGNRLDLDPFLKVNSNPRRFSPSPNGHDLSTSATFTYGLAGEVKAYFIDQTNLVGVPVDDPSFTGTFNSDVGSGLSVLTWKDILGPLSVTTSLSAAGLERREDFGTFRLAADQRQRQLFGQVTWEARPGVVVRAGGEAERVRSAIRGSLPASFSDRGPGGRTTLFALDEPGTRVGTYFEAELQPHAQLKLVPGVRTDRSTLTSQTTVDPRFSAAWRLVEGVVLTGAWGMYHQVPDALFFDDSLGRAGLPAMRARQWVVGLQAGDDGTLMARVEAYAKRYEDLALQDRDFHITEGGRGSSRGVDLFFKGPIAWGITMRSIMSYLVARRTDATTGTLSRAPFDVTWSRSIIAEKAFANGARAGVTYRASTGRPYTPILGADLDPSRDVYLPRHGVPMSERFPGIRRLDVSVSRYRPITPRLQSVMYVSLANVLNSENAQSWKYSRDYSRKSPVASIFNRSVYFGATLIWQ